MDEDPDIERLAGALKVGLGMLTRRLRSVQADGELTLPETTTLARLDRYGPTTAAALAKVEQISQQSMGATLRVLEDRGYIVRRPDPDDGRQAVISISEAGLRALLDVRAVRTQLIARALTSALTAAERAQLAAVIPLLEKVAQTI
ncbi:MAG: MarR family transcriptional regulator [Vulcanimicrobiaceae bacterium]|jgi:DNA-binding MarR family transcriptional regulator